MRATMQEKVFKPRTTQLTVDLASSVRLREIWGKKCHLCRKMHPPLSFGEKDIGQKMPPGCSTRPALRFAVVAAVVVFIVG